MQIKICTYITMCLTDCDKVCCIAVYINGVFVKHRLIQYSPGLLGSFGHILYVPNNLEMP